jgi:hypothetical protein
MVSKLPSRGRSFASDRALVEMAKTMDLNVLGWPADRADPEAAGRPRRPAKLALGRGFPG